MSIDGPSLSSTNDVQGFNPDEFFKPDVRGHKTTLPGFQYVNLPGRASSFLRCSPAERINLIVTPGKLQHNIIT